MKNNVEIPLSLLKELYNNATDDMKGKIEACVPGIITKFKNGDWVKSKAGSLVCITDINKGFGYGFYKTKEWCYDGDDVWIFRSLKSNWTLASMEEVHLALDRESMKRGFLYDEKFKALDDKENWSGRGDNPNIARVGSVGSVFENGVLYCRGFGKWAMFKDGVWAIPYKRDEIEKEIELYKERIEKLKLKLNNHN